MNVEALQPIDAAKKPWWSWRLVLLIALFGLEWLLLYSVKVRGWVATTSSWYWTVSLAAAVLPLVMAMFVIFRNGVRIRLRSLLIGISLFCVFVSVSMTPLMKARNARRAARVLLREGVELRPFAQSDFQADGANFQRKFSTPTDIPEWMAPLAGDLQRIPLDTEIRGIRLNSDADIDALATVASSLDNLNDIELYSRITDAGLERLASIRDELGPIRGLVVSVTETSSGGLNALNKFTDIEFLLLSGVSMPTADWYSRHPKLRILQARNETAAYGGSKMEKWTTEQLANVASLENLEHLAIVGYDFLGADISVLKNARQLQSLRFFRCRNIDPQQLRVVTELPGLDFHHVGP